MINLMKFGELGKKSFSEGNESDFSRQKQEKGES